MTSFDHTGKLVVISRTGADRLSVEWQIPNISTLLTISNDICTRSPEFRLGEDSWLLLLCPNWKTKQVNPRTGFLRLGLRRQGEYQHEAFLHFSVAIRGVKGFKNKNKMIWLFSDIQDHHWCKFIKRNNLMKLEKELMWKDKLRILCTLERVVPIAVTGPSTAVKSNYHGDDKNKDCKNDYSDDNNKVSKGNSFTHQNLAENAEKSPSTAVKSNYHGDDKNKDCKNVNSNVNDKVSKGKSFTHQNLAENAEKSSSNDIEDNNGDNNAAEVQSDDENNCEEGHGASDSKSIKEKNLIKNTKTSLPEDVEDDNADEEDCKDDKVPKTRNKVRQSCLVKNAKKRFSMLVKDLGRLLLSGENSDVTLQVGDTEFKAHQNILSARSPVLSAMLKNKTPDGGTVKLSVCDCEPDIFKEYLFYLYTGSVELLSEENVFQLYRVASNYVADELKEQCLIYVRYILNVQTFCDTIKLALIYGESGLLEQALHFATENIRSIVRTKEWQDFNCEYPSEANEVLIKALGPPTEDHKSKRQKTEEKSSC